MKKIIIIIILILAFSIPSFARKGRRHLDFLDMDYNLRLTFDLSANFLDFPGHKEIGETFRNNGGKDGLLFGFGVENIFDKFGFGSDGLVKFPKDQDNEWMVDWDFTWYGSFHIFGGNSFFDLYLELGFGTAGRYYDGKYQTEYIGNYASDTPDDIKNLLLSVYGFGSLGMNFNFDGLIIGTKFRYRPYSSSIPHTQILEYPVTQFQVTAFVGYNFNFGPAENKDKRKIKTENDEDVFEEEIYDEDEEDLENKNEEKKEPEENNEVKNENQSAPEEKDTTNNDSIERLKKDVDKEFEDF